MRIIASCVPVLHDVDMQTGTPSFHSDKLRPSMQSGSVLRPVFSEVQEIHSGSHAFICSGVVQTWLLRLCMHIKLHAIPSTPVALPTSSPTILLRSFASSAPAKPYNGIAGLLDTASARLNALIQRYRQVFVSESDGSQENLKQQRNLTQMAQLILSRTYRVSDCEHSQGFARLPNLDWAALAGQSYCAERADGPAEETETTDFAPTCGAQACTGSAEAFEDLLDSSETSAASWRNLLPSDRLKKGQFRTTPSSHAPQYAASRVNGALQEYRLAACC